MIGGAPRRPGTRLHPLPFAGKLAESFFGACWEMESAKSAAKAASRKALLGVSLVYIKGGAAPLLSQKHVGKNRRLYATHSRICSPSMNNGFSCPVLSSLFLSPRHNPAVWVVYWTCVSMRVKRSKGGQAASEAFPGGPSRVVRVRGRREGAWKPKACARFWRQPLSEEEQTGRCAGPSASWRK